MYDSSKEASITITIEQDGERITYISPKSSFVNVECIDVNQDFYPLYGGSWHHFPDYRFNISFKPMPFNKEGHYLKATKEDV